MSGTGDGGFLSRWSRRKRAAVSPLPPRPPVAPAAPPPKAVPPETGAPAGAEGPPFDPASLPSVESLTAHSDFTAFLREGVPAALRRAALRRAWSLDPAIRDFTGPADYAWDFNALDGGMPGFSLDLPDDVERLLAQAIGLETPPAERAPDEEPPRLAVEVAALPPEPAALEATRVAPPPVPVVEAPDAEPVPAALPDPPAKAAEAPSPTRRRHGGALPS